MNKKDIVITSAFRTPIGSFEGRLREFKAYQLGSTVIKECLVHSKLESKDVDEVIMGLVLQAGCGQNPARQSSLNAGIDKSPSASTIIL